MTPAVANLFSWRSFDVRSLLPHSWDKEIRAVAEHAVPRVLVPRSVTSREGDPSLKIPVLTVGGAAVRDRLNWLYQLYTQDFLTLVQSYSSQRVSPAKNDLYGAVLNVQRGNAMRYEAHVDSNPIEALLYVTTHAPGRGGELVVANDPNANSVAAIDASASIIYPIAGQLVVFDARAHAHYVRRLRRSSGLRVVVAMNYYTPDCPESARPADLNAHLFGIDA